MGQKKKLNTTLLRAAALTLIAILAYELIPERSYKLIPHSGNWRNELFQAYSDDQLQAAEWINRDKFHFACKRQEDERPQLCGANMYYGYDLSLGDDLSGYSQLVIKAKFSGDAPRIRLFMRNYNEEYSESDDANSAKYLHLNLQTSEFQAGEVHIGLDEFVVAEWWKEQRTLHRSQLPPEFGNVSTIGFDVSISFFQATEVELEVESMYLIGEWVSKDNWYLGILVFWLLMIPAGVLYQYLSLLNRSKAYTQVITELVTDKAELEQRSQVLQELSQLDKLTGAYNRSGIENSFKRIVSGQNSKLVGLIVIDLDHFKRINDQRGHDVGDQVLKEVVARLHEGIRENDVLGRWGGEEFILLTPNVSEEHVYTIADKLRGRIAEKEFDVDMPLRVTASFGVTIIAQHEDFSLAFKRADQALYTAKAQGRNCVVQAEES
ncbi:diguanylate cyclase (GGDEF) domain-containing protein [Alteromonadaceae bacterium Bs31]|nr:diguanylate cyclase (GGDEF) domain-containing protein [Alteromonadaceae bacterium Bs31]